MHKRILGFESSMTLFINGIPPRISGTKTYPYAAHASSAMMDSGTFPARIAILSFGSSPMCEGYLKRKFTNLNYVNPTQN